MNKSLVKAYWYKSPVPNFGDEITPYIIDKMFGAVAIHRELGIPFLDRIVYGAGSIISHAKIPFTAVVWGAGIISRFDRIRRPYSILAVRGPESRSLFIKNGIPCPEVYGDPGVLLPLIYQPNTGRGNSKGMVGVVPHYVDIPKVQDLISGRPWLRLVDVRKGIENVVNTITECEFIISSSLHGLVVASAYEIPCCWVKFSNNLYGDDVKFHDFFKACGGDATPISISTSDDLDSLLSNRFHRLPDVSVCQKSLIENSPIEVKFPNDEKNRNLVEFLPVTNKRRFW